MHSELAEMWYKDEFYSAMVSGEGKRERLEDKARGEPAQERSMAALWREMHIRRAKSGPPSLIFPRLLNRSYEN